MKKLIVILFLLAAAGGGGYLYWIKRPKKEAPAYRTATITRGTVIQDVRATGTVEPIKQVEVGTQVNGRIVQLFADFNSVVTGNQVVAIIDPAVYAATYAKDCAQLKSNEANVEQIIAKLKLAEKDLGRKNELAARNMISKSDLDTAVADRDALAAQLKIAQSSVEQSKASIKLSQANLDYCTIRSPVDGVVIARNVDEGQTVVSSMSAQKLFQIATDLRRIQVEASIPEADVGVILTNQPVRFTVDAYRDTFSGEVVQVRLAATTVQNVVTYPVIVEADNPALKLFPGMTADLSIEVARRENAITAPAAALRFMPTNLVSDVHGPKIWILNDQNQPEAVPIKIDISDGTRIALVASDELENKEVILGFQNNRKDASSDATPKNPFMPTPPGGSNRTIRHAMR